MKRKGNILNQIEEEIEKVEQGIDKNKKQIKERKFIRNTVISSISKDVSLMNDQWKTYLVKLKNEISDAGFLKKYIKQFELSPITKDEFIACFDFLFDLNISSMRFSKKNSGDGVYPYIAICCPCNKDNKMVQKWNLMDSSKKDFFGNEFIVFSSGSNGVKYAAIYVGSTPENNINIKLSNKKTSYNSFDEWGVFSAVLQRLISGFNSQGSRFITLENILVEISSLENEIDKLHSKLNNLHEQLDEIKSIAVEDEKLNEILNLIGLFKSGGNVIPKGIILYGPPGTGKTMIARMLAKNMKCHFESVNVSDLKGPYIGHSAQRVKECWEKCREKSPSILFVDECEGVFPRRGSTHSDSFSDELVQTFISEWDGFNNSTDSKVLVIGATNRNDILDDAVMSRFTSSIEIGLPKGDLREKIFYNEFKNAGIKINIDEKIIVESAGLSGRDIKTIVAKIYATIDHESDISSDYITEEITRFRGKSSVLPAGLSWDDIILPKDVLFEFKLLGTKLKHSESLKNRNHSIPKTTLLFGPPGTGKTQLAKVLASQSGLSFISRTTAQLKSGHIGKSSQNIKEMFDEAESKSPCIIFIDEIDILTPGREQSNGDSFNNEIIGQLLQELDGIHSRENIFLLAATNFINRVDSALMSRMQNTIEIGLPDLTARMGIIKQLINNKIIDFDENELIANLADKTEGLSGRDLKSIVERAADLAINRYFDFGENNGDIIINKSDFFNALSWFNDRN